MFQFYLICSFFILILISYAKEITLDKIFPEKFFQQEDKEDVQTFRSKLELDWSLVATCTKRKINQNELIELINKKIIERTKVLEETTGEKSTHATVFDKNNDVYLSYVISPVKDRKDRILVLFDFSYQMNLWSGQFGGSMNEWLLFLEAFKSKETQSTSN
jgi:hypothetical protein